MKKLLLELYSLKRRELKALRAKYSDEKLLAARKKFMFGKVSSPLTIVSLYHYIDSHGNFISGKRCHQRIAEAFYNGLTSKLKLAVLEYIDEFGGTEDER